ncbi:ABC transporter ATP-binding protein [Paenarthrobacter ureafaciens]|nr:ABC transporter ATP-binding protein [Paenarthrobacter ureafaciens]RWW94840.1 ABC transporter ATP-binding protein [Paenarthrobacter ureafaciens]BCW86231.1 ABC transporter ATP-binding protein [Arthrobacter sp. NicSoilE8]
MRMSINDVSVTFTRAGTTVEALKDINLSLHEGEFVALLGPSGCGKSTLLTCMGGLMTPTKGQILVGDSVVKEPDPRRAAFVFQDYSLLPWKNILDNVGVGLRFAGVSKQERHQRSQELLDMMGLSQWADSHPGQLSGGMQQRVAVARALAMDPSILLMDEPFGALDEQTRRSLGESISTVLTENKQTVVLVTHSLDEAIYWADRVIVMSARPGKVMAEVKIEQMRPRPLDFIATEEFAQLRSRLFLMLNEAMGNGPHANPLEKQRA